MTNGKSNQILLNEFFDTESSKRFVPMITWESVLQYIQTIHHHTADFKHNIIVLETRQFPNQSIHIVFLKWSMYYQETKRI